MWVSIESEIPTLIDYIEMMCKLQNNFKF